MLTAELNALNVNVICKVPDSFKSANNVIIARIYNTSVVKHNVYAAPAVEGLNHSLKLGFFGDIADLFRLSQLGDGRGRGNRQTVVLRRPAVSTSCLTLARALSKAS